MPRWFNAGRSQKGGRHYHVRATAGAAIIPKAVLADACDEARATSRVEATSGD